MVDHRRLGVARGVFCNKGGILEGPGGVTLTVPPGALPTQSQQEIYFSVTAPRIIETHNTSGHCSPVSPPMNHGELTSTHMYSTYAVMGAKIIQF